MSNAKTFKHIVRVPYAHTDQMRFVYYANYLVYFEMARAAMLREAGLPYGELEKQGIFLPVVEAHCEYKIPAHYDDELEIVSRCELQGVRLKVAYDVSRAGKTIVTGYTVHVCVSAQNKVIRPPAALQKLRGQT
jgi:acyl-CoA thioester hydrolase